MKLYRVDKPPRGAYSLKFLEEDREVLDRLRVIAKQERRSIRNLILIILQQWMEGRDGN